MRNKFSIYKKGFTLIELVVIVSIILVLTGMGLAGYNRFNQRATVKQAALGIKTSLRDAQNRALYGDKDITVCSGKNLDFWVFEVNRDLVTYSIYGRCGGSKFKQQNYNLPSVLKFCDVKTFIFKPLNQGVFSSDPLDNMLTISSSGNDLITITVSSSGEITVSDLLTPGTCSTALPTPVIPTSYPVGTVCTNNSDCGSGYCYRDADGDRYAAASGDKVCQASASLGTDCYDSNANAKPGQTTYYTTNRGDGSFDYNCDNIATKRQGYCDQVTSCYLEGSACSDICLSGLQILIRAGGTNEYYACGQAISSYIYCYGIELRTVATCTTSPVRIYRAEGYALQDHMCAAGQGYKSPELKTESRTCSCR